MRTKRINTELYDTITVTDKSGNAIDFSTAYDIYLYLQKQGSSSLLKQDFALNGNTLSYQFNSDENNRGLGTYDLHLEWKKKDANSELTYDQYHFDYLGCFKVVRSSDEENWSEGVSGTVLQFGADGLSAYEIAVKNGFTGTITQWLVSLKGEKGDKGVKGDAFTYSDFTSEQIATLQKPATDAASNLTSFESNITNAENERVIAENARNNAETTRESNSATAVTNANNAASNANTAASNFANAVVQEEGTNTDKVISQKVVTDELANKVDKIAGMGLSTNDYTDAEKTKLSGIASGANVNVIEGVQLNGTDLAITNKKVNVVTSPPSVATTTADGLMSSTDKSKLDGITEKAQVNVIENVKIDTTLLAIADKTVTISIADSSKSGAMSKDQAKYLVDSKNTNSIQDTVVAEIIAKLISEVNNLKKIITNGNLGDIHVGSITSDSVPKFCEQQMIIKGSGSPVTNSIIPDFEGQIYIDTTNRNAYMCCDSASITYWKQLN